MFFHPLYPMTLPISHQKPLHSLVIQYRPSTSTRRASYNSDELRPIKSWRRRPLTCWCTAKLCGETVNFVVKFIYQALFELLSYQSSSVCSTVNRCGELCRTLLKWDILIADHSEATNERDSWRQPWLHSTGVWFRSAQDPSLCHLELGRFFRLKNCRMVRGFFQEKKRRKSRWVNGCNMVSIYVNLQKMSGCSGRSDTKAILDSRCTRWNQGLWPSHWEACEIGCLSADDGFPLDFGDFPEVTSQKFQIALPAIGKIHKQQTANVF